ncbi:MAG: NAD-dependent epimerase/dehydratase family protein, partial [Chloroflexi bacterium]
MRALITGINGFVGGHLAEYLLADGRWEVWGLSRSATITLPELAG